MPIIFQLEQAFQVKCYDLSFEIYIDLYSVVFNFLFKLFFYFPFELFQAHIFCWMLYIKAVLKWSSPKVRDNYASVAYGQCNKFARDSSQSGQTARD